MNAVEKIDHRRRIILKEMSEIRSMKKGTINEQFLEVKQKGKREPALRGPYYVLSRREGKKTVSKRLTSKKELERASEDIKAHGRFRELCREFEGLTERLGELERELDEGSREKKLRRSPSRKTRK